MWIGYRVHPLILGAIIFASPLRQADEKTLIGRESVTVFQCHIFGGILPGDVGQNRSAKVGNVLAFGQLRIDVDVVNDDVLRILVHDAVGVFHELIGVFLGPPVFQIPLGIELAAFVVEAVGQLVADGGAGIAVVRSVVQFGVVERRLQNTSGEIDVVHLRIEVGIDGGRRHAPFAAVHGLPDFVQLAMSFELGGAQVVTIKIIGHNFHRAVVAPNVGIADFVTNGVQLGQRLLLGFGAHPIQLLNTQRHSVFDAPGHVHRGSFQFGRERFAHVCLSQGFSEIAVNVAHATFPARLKLFGAAQVFAVKVEVFIYEGSGQIWRAGIGDMKPKIGLPVLE